MFISSTIYVKSHYFIENYLKYYILWAYLNYYDYYVENYKLWYKFIEKIGIWVDFVKASMTIWCYLKYNVQLYKIYNTAKEFG